MRPSTLRARLLVAFLLPTLFLFAAASGLAYLLARQALEQELGRSLAAIAAAAASQINGERLLAITAGDDVSQSRTYRNVLATLTEVKTASGVRRAFAVDLEGTLRADTERALPVGAPMPELARDRLELSRVHQGEPTASQVLFVGADGKTYKTGYAPVSSNGRVVGAVGVEAAAHFYAPLRRLPLLFGGLGAAMLALVTGAAFAVARSIALPVRRLVDSATRIGGGDLETRVPQEGPREIGLLAGELDAMRGALGARDRQLKLMLAGVAHEVRNPLGGIKLFAGLLAEELQSSQPSQADARAHVERIRSEIDYLERIVEDFLAFAREQKVTPVELEMPQVLQVVAEVLRPEADKRRVAVAVTAEPARVSADESLLSAALVNLVKNAIQASPDGERVEVTGRRDGTRYEIQVADSGGGIAPEAQGRIFEPFFTTREKGTGLGLPLARKMLQAHGGELSVTSRPGRTVFTASLPIERGFAPAAGSG